MSLVTTLDCGRTTGWWTGRDSEGQQFHINYQPKVNGQSIEVEVVDILEKSIE